MGQKTRRAFRVSEVSGENLRLDLVRFPQLGSQRLERIALARHQSEPAAVRRETPGQLKTDARRRPGD